jgi:hypothetical protein
MKRGHHSKFFKNSLIPGSIEAAVFSWPLLHSICHSKWAPGFLWPHFGNYYFTVSGSWGCVWESVCARRCVRGCVCVWRWGSNPGLGHSPSVNHCETLQRKVGSVHQYGQISLCCFTIISILFPYNKVSLLNVPTFKSWFISCCTESASAPSLSD